MTATAKQVWLLLWKNWIISKRHKTATFFELLIPLFCSFLIGWIGSFIEQAKVEVVKPEPRIMNKSTIYLNDANIVRYAPENNITTALMKSVVENFVKVSETKSATVNAQGYASEKELVSAYLKDAEFFTRISVIFTNIKASDQVLPQMLEFQFRTPFDRNLKTGLTAKFIPGESGGLTPDFDYSIETDVIRFQALLTSGILDYWKEKGVTTGSSDNKFFWELYNTLTLEQFPIPPTPKGTKFIEVMFKTFLKMATFFSVVITTKRLVEEKEKRIKESMKLVGLSPVAHSFSWFLTIMLKMIIPIISFVLGLCGSFTESGPYLAHSNPVLIFIYLLFYFMAVTCFCFMTSTFVKTGTAGSLTSGILYFFSDALLYWKGYWALSKFQKIFFSLMLNCSMTFFAIILEFYEGLEEGVQFSNLHKPVLLSDNFTVLEAIIMLIVVSFLYLFIGWYIDNVFPGEFGIPQHPCFFLMKEYWSPTDDKFEGVQDVAVIDPKYFELEPKGLTAGIQIQSLTKKFGGTWVVSGSSMNMYKGQISVLLGHNGAGKTTTMSMLTGFINPTSGTALINGYDIKKNLRKARESIGLCPQFNVLFDELTVEEHLWFFGQIKGLDKTESREEAAIIIQELGLNSKATSRAQFLSGGQKRKLSVGVSLIGNSKVIILDEPTAAMDPSSRRETWTVLQKYKEDRTIMLTTHFMDEADVLGDRIAIMSDGLIHCCGSPMFLKNIYGAGYRLVVVKNNRCDVASLTRFIQTNILTASLEKVVNTEVIYLLPTNTTTHFSRLFKALDDNMNYLGITTYGISATTMEEVFLKVGQHVPDEANSVSTQKTVAASVKPVGETEDFRKSMHILSIVAGEEVTELSNNNDSLNEMEANNETTQVAGTYTKQTGLRLLLSQFYGLIVKKAINAYRSLLFTLVQVLVPAVPFFLLYFIVSKYRTEAEDPPPLWFNLKKFHKPVVLLSEGADVTKDTTAFIEHYRKRLESGNYKIENVEVTSTKTFQDHLADLALKLKPQIYRETYIIGAEVLGTASSKPLYVKAYFNNEAYHGQPIAFDHVCNAILQLYTNASFSITSGIYPLPQREEYKNAGGNALILLPYLGFFLCLHVTLAIRFLIIERFNGAKHLQRASGMNLLVYWFSIFIWDYFLYTLVALSIIITLSMFDGKPYSVDGNIGFLLLILMLYGWAALAFVYLFQFLFSSPGTGISFLIAFKFMTGLMSVLILQILVDLQLKGAVGKMKKMSWFIPTFNMLTAIWNIEINYNNLKKCNTPAEQKKCETKPEENECCEECTLKFCKPFQEDYMSWSDPGIGKLAFALALQGLIYFSIIIIMELRILQRIWYANRTRLGLDDKIIRSLSDNEDADVAEERERINAAPPLTLTETDPLLLVNLTKTFGTYVAVDKLCVGIPAKECFGLLGVNGAGKTTTFKMITGDDMISGGNAYLNGYDVKRNIAKVQAQMGYCPQFDPLIESMTGREVLTLFARIRGIPSEHIDSVVTKLMTMLCFDKFADKKCGVYSGGNKRKLSVAMSLIGDPPFLMFDEPSAGMDPQAKRHMWDVLSQIRESGRTLVLTSHSMDECDALCTRLGIMVNGKFMCLGSPQHLKNKFGKGYTLTVKVLPNDDPNVNLNTPIIQYLQENFKNIKVVSDCVGYIDFQVPDPNVKLSDIFAIMESTKDNLSVEDYTVLQTTLEQVFLGFAKEQNTVKKSKGKRRCFCC